MSNRTALERQLHEALLAMYQRYVLGRDTITNAADLAEDALTAADNASRDE